MKYLFRSFTEASMKRTWCGHAALQNNGDGRNLDEQLLDINMRRCNFVSVKLFDTDGLPDSVVNLNSQKNALSIQ